MKTLATLILILTITGCANEGLTKASLANVIDEYNLFSQRDTVFQFIQGKPDTLFDKSGKAQIYNNTAKGLDTTYRTVKMGVLISLPDYLRGKR